MAADDRLRVSVEDTYVSSIGRATYVFAILEWNAVWCGERLDAGFLSKMQKKKMTAGQMGKALLVEVNKIADAALKAACQPPVDEFVRLVNVRNGILHWKPGTEAGTNAQRMFHDGNVWSSADIDQAADDFAECSSRLNALLYNELAMP